MLLRHWVQFAYKQSTFRGVHLGIWKVIYNLKNLSSLLSLVLFSLFKYLLFIHVLYYALKVDVIIDNITILISNR